MNEFTMYEDYIADRRRTKRAALRRLLVVWLVAGVALLTAAMVVERLGVLP